ncbi:MAG: PilZ domain-containing protein [Magnetococcales bacterium]|nr:PilZ domain-containing protein [Magnetococcales bacterium]
MAAKSSGQKNQQRAFARIDDHLPLGWRRVASKEMKAIADHYAKFRTFPTDGDIFTKTLDSLDITDRLKQLEKSDPNLSHILGRLDMKVNLLLRLFHPGEQERPMVPTWVNLSGGGIAFKEEQSDFEEGEILEIRLSFSIETMASIRFYARIMKVFPQQDDGLSKIACAFDPILDRDREALIQHVFKRQTEELRTKRNR